MKELVTRKSTAVATTFRGGSASRRFHTSTQDGQPHKEDEEEEVEAALFLLWRRGADGVRGLETSFAVGQPWANGKLCWQRRAGAPGA